MKCKQERETFVSASKLIYLYNIYMYGPPLLQSLISLIVVVVSEKKGPLLLPLPLPPPCVRRDLGIEPDTQP